MDIDDAIYGRRAVREYTTEPVSEATIKNLIDAAIHAPSAVNAQPWSFIVVRDQQILASMSQHAKAHVLATEADSLPLHMHTSLADPESQIFHGAPVLIVISATAPAPWIVEDCALAAENLMLCAFAHRLGNLLDRLCAALAEYGRRQSRTRIFQRKWCPWLRSSSSDRLGDAERRHVSSHSKAHRFDSG